MEQPFVTVADWIDVPAEGTEAAEPIFSQYVSWVVSLHHDSTESLISIFARSKIETVFSDSINCKVKRCSLASQSKAAMSRVDSVNINPWQKNTDLLEVEITECFLARKNRILRHDYIILRTNKPGVPFWRFDRYDTGDMYQQCSEWNEAILTGQVKKSFRVPNFPMSCVFEAAQTLADTDYGLFSSNCLWFADRLYNILQEASYPKSAPFGTNSSDVDKFLETAETWRAKGVILASYKVFGMSGDLHKSLRNIRAMNNIVICLADMALSM